LATGGEGGNYEWLAQLWARAGCPGREPDCEARGQRRGFQPRSRRAPLGSEQTLHGFTYTIFFSP